MNKLSRLEWLVLFFVFGLVLLGLGALFLLTSLIPHDKNAELLEFNAAFIFSLIILFPASSAAFDQPYTLKRN